MNKTQRLLHSFQSVELKPEHENHGNESPALRDFGFSVSIATALIRWGEQHFLVCTFENCSGKSNNTYSWQPEFLIAATDKHTELYGEEFKADIPDKLYQFVERIKSVSVPHEPSKTD